MPWRRSHGTPVGAVIPTGYQAYARIFHPARARDDRTLVSWADVAAWAGRSVHPQMQWEAISRPAGTAAGAPPWSDEPTCGWIPPEVRQPLVELLRRYTDPEADCWACIWDGTAPMDAFAGAPRVRLPGRDYVLFRCSLQAIHAGVLLRPLSALTGLNLWWPNDRSWFVSTEIDFGWTYVAGSRACIESVIGDPRLEALATEPDHRGDYLSDTINGPVEP
jgi:hypothetical protein